MGRNDKDWLVEATRGAREFQGPLAGLRRFFLRDVWQAGSVALSRRRGLLNRIARVGFLAARGFVGDGCMARAAALTYVTALSVIPMLALAFSMLKGLGVYDDLVRGTINPYLDRVLGGQVSTTAEGLTGPELRLAIHEILTKVETTNFGGLGFIGLVIVLWAAMRLLGSVETAFNKIWGVARARSLVRRVTDYLAIVIAVPLLLVVAVGVGTALTSTRVMTFLRQDLSLGPAIQLGVRTVPFLAGWVVFTFVYVVMPNTRSSVRSALLGGLVANALWQLALWGHVQFQIGVANYNEIYAGFAAIPVFLVWVQVSWVIVLLGAELAFAHEHEPAYRGLAVYRELDHRARETLVLRAVLRITQNFLGRGGALGSAQLAMELGVQPHEVDAVLRTLEDDGILIASEDRGDVDVGFALARDPGVVTVKQVLDALKNGPGGAAAISARSPGDEVLDRLLARIEAELAGSAHNLDLRELVRRVERDVEALELRTGQVTEPGVQPS